MEDDDDNDEDDDDDDDGEDGSVRNEGNESVAENAKLADKSWNERKRERYIERERGERGERVGGGERGGTRDVMEAALRGTEKLPVRTEKREREKD